MKKYFVSLGIAIAFLGITSLSQATLLSFNDGSFSFGDDSSGGFSFSWDNTSSSGYYASLHEALSQWSSTLGTGSGGNSYDGSFSYRINQAAVTNGAPAPVPEPATMLLFGTGLVGLASLRLRMRNRK